MTEEEAKTKWCPFAISAVQSGSVNRVFFPSGKGMLNAEKESINCIGSACMMWRWNFTEHGMRELYAGRLDTTKPIDGFMPHGYCGLAGKT